MSFILPNLQYRETKVTGMLLAVICVLGIFAMLHHPSVASNSIHEQIREVSHEAKINTLVHGVLTAFIILINLCLSHYGKIRGFNRSSIFYGIAVYWIGTIVMALAALMSGIVGPELANHYLLATPDQAEVFRGIFLLTSEINLAFAYFSVYCWCAGICCWSFDMFQQNKIIKIFGIVSLLTAIFISISLLFGWVTLSIFGMTIILIAFNSWHLGIAWLLYSHDFRNL